MQSGQDPAQRFSPTPDQPTTPSDMSEDDAPALAPLRSPSHARSEPTENLYEMVKARFERMCFMIHSPFLYGVVHEDEAMEPSFLKHNELKQYFCNWVHFEACKVDDQNPSGWKSVRFIDTWLMDLSRREVSRVVVDPRNTEVGVYNLWKPLIASQLPHVEPTAPYEDLLSPIFDHIHHVVTEQNAVHTNWLLDWMANMVQRPHMRSQVGILLYGKQGCGKGIIIDWMRKAVLGPACSFQTADPENDILGRFANGLTNKVLVQVRKKCWFVFDFDFGSVIDSLTHPQIDEVKSLVNHADALKNIITNSTLRHEKKGKDVISVDNLANLIFTSNNENALAVPSDDRRFVFFRCSSVYKGDKAYFDRLGAFLDSPGIDRLFYQFLMQVEAAKRCLICFVWAFTDSRTRVCRRGTSRVTGTTSSPPGPSPRTTGKRRSAASPSSTASSPRKSTPWTCSPARPSRPAFTTDTPTSAPTVGTSTRSTATISGRRSSASRAYARRGKGRAWCTPWTRPRSRTICAG